MGRPVLMAVLQVNAARVSVSVRSSRVTTAIHAPPTRAHPKPGASIAMPVPGRRIRAPLVYVRPLGVPHSPPKMASRAVRATASMVTFVFLDNASSAVSPMGRRVAKRRYASPKESAKTSNAFGQLLPKFRINGFGYRHRIARCKAWSLTNRATILLLNADTPGPFGLNANWCHSQIREPFVFVLPIRIW